MSSWSDKELEKLCDPDNHKIVSDGYDYRWYHNLTGKWEVHSIEVFEDFNKPYSWLQYNLHKWNQELLHRRRKEARRKKMITRKIRRICEESEYDTYQRVIEINKLNPDLTQNEIALYLGIGQATVYRYLKSAGGTKDYELRVA